MGVKRFPLACALVVFGATAACSAAPSHGTSRSAQSPVTGGPATSAPRGTLAILAEPCVGTGLDPATHYYPVAVSVRQGSRVVLQATIAGGRVHTLSLPVGAYVVSAPYDSTVTAKLATDATTTAHLFNGCK